MNLLNQMLAALFGIFLTIWLKLRNARKAKGLTIEEAAELIGVAPVTYSRWERLRQKPHPSHQLLLAQMFGEDDSVPEEFLPPSYSERARKPPSFMRGRNGPSSWGEMGEEQTLGHPMLAKVSTARLTSSASAHPSARENAVRKRSMGFSVRYRLVLFRWFSS